jgi:hypothetical protein
MHHPRRIERMESFAPVLQDQHFRPVVNRGNGGAVAIATRSEATDTTLSAGYTCDVLAGARLNSALGLHRNQLL